MGSMQTMSKETSSQSTTDYLLYNFTTEAVLFIHNFIDIIPLTFSIN